MRVAVQGIRGAYSYLAAENIFGRETRFRGSQGTAVCGVFDLTVAMTGASEKALARAGYKTAESVYLHPGHHVGYYPGARPIHLKLTFDRGDGRILGAQAVGEEGAERRIDVPRLRHELVGQRDGPAVDGVVVRDGRGLGRALVGELHLRVALLPGTVGELQLRGKTLVAAEHRLPQLNCVRFPPGLAEISTGESKGASGSSNQTSHSPPGNSVPNVREKLARI